MKKRQQNSHTDFASGSMEYRNKPVKKRSKLKIFFTIILILMIVGFLSVVGVFLYYMKDLPNPGKVNKRVMAESTKIYDRTGEHLLYEIHGEEKRTIIPFEDMPDTVKKATIVLEDRGFYNHHGVDFKGLTRAALKDIIGGGAHQGGSTITQQFIKNSILTSEKKLSRKIKEVVLAIEIEQKFTKDEILQMYLNEIPYGSNAYGVEAAAQTFFGKPAKELTLAQAALVACLPNAPTYYSPFGSHTDALIGRWKKALNGMADLGYITREQADQALSEDILSQIKPHRANMRAPHFVMYVKEHLVDEFGEEEVEKKGLKVYTTLDWNLQQIAERSVSEGVAKHGANYHFANAALVAANPKNGQVLAMVGSKDFFGEPEPKGCISGKNCKFEPQDNVAIRMRQPGSSFKPYAYAEAFTKGYTPDTIIFDVDTEFPMDNGKEYNPKNYDNQNRGPVKMKEALPMSLNVPAVKTVYLAGVKDTLELASSMGITTLGDYRKYGLAVVLGGAEVKLVEHVGAFGVFANQGIKHEQKVILKIEDSAGKILKSNDESKGKRVMEKNTALQITEILSDNSLRAPVFGNNNSLVIPGRQVFGKTGTTNDWKDGWLVGATPSLAAGVWAGNNDSSLMAQGADGSYVAGPIWNSFMTEALRNTQTEEFEKPEKVETKKPILDGTLEVEDEIKVCKIGDGKYCLDEDGECPDSKRKKRKVIIAHDILYYVDRDDPVGDIPQHPEKDPQFDAWEKAVEEWAKTKLDDDKDLFDLPDKCSKDDISDISQPSASMASIDPVSGAGAG